MKKALLSVVATGLVATAVAPSVSAYGNWTGWNSNSNGQGGTAATAPKDFGDNNRFGSSYNPNPTGPVTIKTENTNKHVRVTVVDGGGRPVPGATIDFMLNGYSIGSAVTDQSGDAEAPRLFNQGEVVKFRVGTTATDFKTNFVAGEVTVGADMYTNGKVVLPYKLDDRKPSTNGKTEEGKKEEGKKQDQKQGKDGKKAPAKKLPKTSAAK